MQSRKQLSRKKIMSEKYFHKVLIFRPADSEYPEPNTKWLFSQILQELQADYEFNFLRWQTSREGRNRNAEKGDRLTSGAL